MKSAKESTATVVSFVLAVLRRKKKKKKNSKKTKKKIRRELVDAAQSSLITLASFK